jgi:hypothetical protein
MRHGSNTQRWERHEIWRREKTTDVTFPMALVISGILSIKFLEGA